MNDWRSTCVELSTMLRTPWLAGCLLAGAFVVASVTSSFATPLTVVVANNGVASPVDCVGPPAIPPPLQCSEGIDIVIGGFTQRSASQLVVDGNPSDLILTNFRIRSDVMNAGAITKFLSAGDYDLPDPAGVAWHELHGSVTLLGPIGSFATISVFGTLDGLPTAGISVTVTKTTSALVYNFDARSVNTLFDPPLAPQHTRTATYMFATGGGALPGSEIRMMASGDNPFAVPEPSSLSLLVGGLTAIAALTRRRLRR